MQENLDRVRRAAYGRRLRDPRVDAHPL